jgi:hypothetical protein
MRSNNFGAPPKPAKQAGVAAVRAADVDPGDYTVVGAGQNRP